MRLFAQFIVNSFSSVVAAVACCSGDSSAKHRKVHKVFKHLQSCECFHWADGRGDSSPRCASKRWQRPKSFKMKWEIFFLKTLFKDKLIYLTFRQLPFQILQWIFPSLMYQMKPVKKPRWMEAWLSQILQVQRAWIKTVTCWLYFSSNNREMYRGYIRHTMSLRLFEVSNSLSM